MNLFSWAVYNVQTTLHFHATISYSITYGNIYSECPHKPPFLRGSIMLAFLGGVPRGGGTIVPRFCQIFLCSASGPQVTSPAVGSKAAEEMYLEKLRQLQKHVDPLKRMIAKIEKEEGMLKADVVNSSKAYVTHTCIWIMRSKLVNRSIHTASIIIMD